MWKKDEPEATAGEQEREVKDEESPRVTRSPRPSATADPATIGPSIVIEGGVSGNEDLLIQGRVNGSVDLKEQEVTVGRDGRVKADITGRVVTVEGEVEGDLKAQEQVILRSSARVKGDITAPRVVLEDGARFRGLVDMGDASERRGDGVGASAERGPRSTEPSRMPELGSRTSSSPGKSLSEKVEEDSDTADLDKAAT